MKKFLVFVVMAFWFTLSFSAKLERAETSKAVVAREPFEISDVFTVGEKAYLFNEFVEIGEDETIKHMWFFVKKDGTLEKVVEIPLTIKGNRWRTWSYKTVTRPGTWIVKVTDENGNIIFEKNIEVSE